MDLKNFAVGRIDWSQIPETVYPGESGVATVRSHQLGDIQLRFVVYSADYLADHWCQKGHIAFVVDGQLIIEHQHGITYTLGPGATYHVADDERQPHRLLSGDGATLFIVD